MHVFTHGGGLVFADGAADVLTGNAGRDWFIFNSRGGGVIDVVTDAGATNVVIDV